MHGRDAAEALFRGVAVHPAPCLESDFPQKSDAPYDRTVNIAEE